MEPPRELQPSTSLGQYQIQKWIGAGGMGDVYAAVHKGLNRTVAIKTLQRRFLDDPVTVARFLREGQLATRIRHPNIVDITDVGMIGGMPCLVMELLEGESLSALIKRGGGLPVQELVDLVLPIIGAVEAAHEHGILHRDLKPSNIFLSRAWNGEVVPKILDFGISKSVHDSGDASLTTDSAFVGTPHYASPELMQGDRTADARSDQYSIGVVLYEGATGQKPLAPVGDNFVALALAACAGEFPPPRTIKPELSADFEAVVLRAMALRRKERFTSMRALGEALLPFASERMRLLWSPTFAKPSARDAAALESTAITAIVADLQVRTGNLPLVPSATPPTPFGEGTQSLGGGSAIETRNPTASRRPSSAILGVLVGLVFASVIASVAVVQYTRISAAANAKGDAEPAPEPVSMTFAVSVGVTPESATVELDGVATGVGRLAQTFPRDGRKHVLRAFAPGYETVLVEFDDAHPPPAQIALRPAQTAGTPSATTPPPNAPPHSWAPGRPNRPKGSDGRPRTDNINPWE